MDLVNNEAEAIVALEIIRIQVVKVLMLIYLLLESSVLDDRSWHRCYRKYSLLSKIPKQIEHLNLPLLQQTLLRKKGREGEITTFCNESTASLRDVASCLGAAKDTIKRQEEIFEAIGSLPIFITIQDHINVSNMLVNNEKQMNMFFGMPAAARTEMVKMAIQGELRS